MFNSDAGSSKGISDSVLQSVSIYDAARQADIQPWANMECFQLGRGLQLSTVDCLDLGDQQIVRERQLAPIQKLGITPANFCTVSCCTFDPGFRFSQLGTSSAATMFFMPEQTEFDIYVPTGVQTAYVSLKQDALLDALRTLSPEQWECTPEQLQLFQAVQQSALKTLINQWLLMADSLRSPSGSVDDNLLLHSIAHITAAAAQNTAYPPLTERVQAFTVYRLARAFIADHLELDVVPTVVDICRVIGVSERSLQYAFRAYVEMSPLAYLRLCRLNRARATLRAADPHSTSVTTVAVRFGFLHLGRFSVDYKKIFAESPSATLAS